MTELPKITKFTEELPDRMNMDKETFAKAVYNYLQYFDASFTPDTNNLVDDMNVLSDEMADAKNEAVQAEDVVTASANFKGIWDSNTTYTVPSSIVYNNIYYIALQDNTGKLYNKYCYIAFLYYPAKLYNKYCYIALQDNTGKQPDTNSDYWKSMATMLNGIIKKANFMGDGSTTSFAISGGFDAGYGIVFLNGVDVTKDVDISDGQNIKFNTAPANGDEISSYFFGSFQVADTYTKAEIDAGNIVLNAIKKVDGSDSGLDADLLDGKQASDFADTSLSNVSSIDADTVKGYTLDTMPVGIGVGQTLQYHDFGNGSGTLSRTMDTYYTNTTGKPILVIVTKNYNSSNTGQLSMEINDGSNSFYYYTAYTQYDDTLYAIVPNNCSYSVHIARDTAALGFWLELR